MPARMTIAAVIPLYNGSKFIFDAVRSVLAQTLAPQDIIVVDDGSTDDGAAIVEQLADEHPIRLLRKQHGGQSSARNFGGAHAGTDLIALLDQDDIWYPDHLDELIKPFLGPSADLGWTYSDIDTIDENGLMTARAALSVAGNAHPKRDIVSCLRDDMDVLPSTTLISLAAFKAVGGFDECLSDYADDDLFLRLFRAGYDNVWIKRALTKRRMVTSRSTPSADEAQGASLYARKLIAEFGGDPVHGYVRDILAPRFRTRIAAEYKNALRSGRQDLIRVAGENLSFIKGLLPPNRRSTWTPRNATISVVIPLYNGERFGEQALRSVMQQSLPPEEIIVVNDGSSDSGPQIVERLAAEHPIRLLHKENGGQAAARNFGIAHAGGELIALLDQDDVWYPNHLAELLKPFAKPGDRVVGWVYSNLDEIDEHGNTVTRSCLSKIATQHPKRDLFVCLGEDMFILPSASLFSRWAFDAVGGFDERLMGYEDDDIFLRMFRAGFDNVYIDKALSKWRIFPGSASYAPRMNRSRALYARKLAAAFPDDPDFGRYPTRDRLAPRFLPQMIGVYCNTLRAGHAERIREACDDIAFISRLHRPKVRRLMTLLLPLMRAHRLSRPLLPVAVALRPGIRRLLR